MTTQNSLNNKIKEKSKVLREQLENDTGIKIKNIVLDDDFTEIHERCCENIIGYKKHPMGISHRSILINNQKFYIPICTLEGALVASLCRGIKLINQCGGVNGYVENLGITRSFCVEASSFKDAIDFYKWLLDEANVKILMNAGEEGSRFCKIRSITSRHVIGRTVFVKVAAFTGDAMGMNMVTKACNQIVEKIYEIFGQLKLVCISANICTDKKWSIENICNGRGRRVFLNIQINENLLRNVMKVSIDDVLKVYQAKIVIGGALTLGGYNCQASNYVAATFLAFNQDLGHIIESSNCIISMYKDGDNLDVSLYMPSLVVGTVGGGTHLEPSKSLFKMLDELDKRFIIKHSEKDLSCSSNNLALVIASAVLAGEISCISSLTDNTLMSAHLRLNRRSG